MVSPLNAIFILLEQYNDKLQNISQRLKCVLCMKVLKNAKQTKCGCKVCEKCIKQYVSMGPKPCPNNQSDCVNVVLNTLEDIYQDNATNKEIANLEVKCQFELCSFYNPLFKMVEHVNKCKFREIACEKCQQTLSAKDKDDHDKEKCDMRMVNCQFCHQQITFKYLNDIHLNSNKDDLCTEYVGICPNNCSVKSEINLKIHLQSCTNKNLECPFHFFDCSVDKMSKDDLMKHIQEEYIGHMSSLINEIKEFKQFTVNLQSQLESQKAITEELFTMNKILSENNLKLIKKVEELEKKSTTTIRTFDNKVEFRNGNFIWKVTDFESHKFNAERGGRISITSDPFYTSEFGYKMCLRIYPAGDGVGKGSYLSVFFAIMKGDYDDLLPWPFKQKVTLSILDQESCIKHYSDTFKPDARSSCYQKPTDECNIASGSPKFIPLSQLTNNSIFYKNDTIYLKISVDLAGISKL